MTPRPINLVLIGTSIGIAVGSTAGVLTPFGWLASAIGAAAIAGVGIWCLVWWLSSCSIAEREAFQGQLNILVRPDKQEDHLSPADIVQDVQTITNKLALMNQLFDALDSAALVMREDGAVIHANPAACEYLDIPEIRIVGRAINTLFTEADVNDLCSRALQGDSASKNIRFNRPHIAGIFSCSACPIDLGESIGAFLLIRDVTALAQASEMKTDFVGNASHELRTPIAAIRAAVDTLMGPAKDDAMMRERLIEMIRDHVVRLEELVRDLLDLSRFESPEYRGDFAVVNCFELCAEIEALVATQREARQVTVDFELDEQLRSIRTNPKTLLLILRNLVDNVIKFSHEHGTVQLVGILESDTTDVAQFRVVDRGIGIPLAEQARIFDRFFQVDEARSGGQPRRGTGLGLAIVKHAVNRLNGSIEVESVWNEGTTMTVRLPIERAD